MFTLLIFAIKLFYYVFTLPLPDQLEIVPRSGWKAKPPKFNKTALITPVPFVVIHYSFIPGLCTTNKECVEAMQHMQQFHQEGNNWTDIGFNFGIGSNSIAYEGRGWDTVGAHTPGFNNISIGIVIIGDWRYELPPKKQIIALRKLIELGVETGYIAVDYDLIGHRQVRATDCPGERLFRELQVWDHFCPNLNNCNHKNPIIVAANNDSRVLEH